MVSTVAQFRIYARLKLEYVESSLTTIVCNIFVVVTCPGYVLFNIFFSILPFDLPPTGLNFGSANNSKSKRSCAGRQRRLSGLSFFGGIATKAGGIKMFV